MGTMVESSVASAAGLHLALVLHDAATVEMGGPIMLAEDVGGLRTYYEHARVTGPAGHGLGVEPEEAVLKRYAGERDWITVYCNRAPELCLSLYSNSAATRP